ncbi:blr7788 [Bradyrhizobium diazoefficiens USDA 110]|uniref:Blr7788 protein n=1 Tax=Bradyrhizobium diazoefficiens (strain JCM 10833 / BCRC 13528 / IAM 13628 / NBRC 14792 / USDA 110) TaxID=224911 RepID=Q89CK9_BRADU|nr:blr7788 [Bradyrhizobium diazoefficiens USDA 110]
MTLARRRHADRIIRIEIAGRGAARRGGATLRQRGEGAVIPLPAAAARAGIDVHADGIAGIEGLRMRRRGRDHRTDAYDQAERETHEQCSSVPHRGSLLLHLLVTPARRRRRLVKSVIGIEVAARGAARRRGATLRQRGEGAVVIVAAAAPTAGRVDVHAHRIARIIGLGARICRSKQRDNRGEGQDRQTHGDILESVASADRMPTA